MNINSLGYTYSILLNDNELVHKAVGGYSDYGGKYTLNFTSERPTIARRTDNMIDVAFEAYEATVHYVLFTGLAGFYEYNINKNLGEQGECRSLWRLDPNQFTNGRTNIKNGPLPLLKDIQTGYKVEDETWQRPNGSYITKYDWSCFVRDLDFHGVYGNGVGAWVIAPGKDYYIGDQLKQELMLHRESSTNDTVLLHMYHGSHYNSEFSNLIPRGKMWGPWLVYFNDGDVEDAAKRTQQEFRSWPYGWLTDSQYEARGSLTGRLMLSDGRPASGAAVFLGDEGDTCNQGTTYQYTSYADDAGNFEFDDVRREKQYTMQAWANGGKIGDVQTVFVKPNITIGENTPLGKLTWPTSGREVAWQIGEFDRKTLGFKLSDHPMEHGLSDRGPANLIYAIGVNKPSDWWIIQSAQGNWTVLFDVPEPKGRTGMLSLSFAGYTSQNGYGLGADSYSLPEITPTGLNNATDGAIYRSAVKAGGYYFSEFHIPNEVLINGSNRLDLTTTQNHRWRGIMWDALKFEWN
ncbi:galactose-binding like protein [Rhizodiscina lignyota]|uniref:rhamnogalacturonan endolyase n=1 Tax=Rhizodiscina lignyota TaxID=1504668 RepID=A0A9P4I7K7_9PEZI|nr:galactose-binding like protein [Rhizodiscina lignyota]